MEASSPSTSVPEGPAPVGLGRTGRLCKFWLLLQTLLVTINGEEVSGTPEGEQVVPEAVVSPEDDALAKVRLPHKLPSIIEIKKALPPHCFESSLPTSLYFMGKDFLLVVVTYTLCHWAWGLLPLYCLVLLTPLYWLLQGTFFTSIFIVGHDGGHGSFSDYEVINDVCGNICHTFLLCPYYMWKVSHRNHHKNTGNLDKDEVFYPVRKKDDRETGLIPWFGLGIGWFAYLIKGYNPRGVEHFNPLHIMFRRHVLQCSVSLGCIAAWSMVLYRFYESQGLGALLYHYAVPLFIFASYTVIITFLHHTEVEIPWYSDHLWDNVRGQLSSVDRNYGWCHNIIHNIGTHQIHHLFSKVPHYHLEEATVHFRKAFPKLVNIRSDPILPAFFRMFKKYASQNVIPNETEVHLYK